MGPDLTIRPFETIEEFQDCVRLQKEAWGSGFSDLVGVAILKVSQRLGGIAAGAYDESGELAGFVYGMTGVESGEVVHCPTCWRCARGSRTRAWALVSRPISGTGSWRWGSLVCTGRSILWSPRTRI